MGLLEEIKNDAIQNWTNIQSDAEKELECKLNSLHYLEKDIPNELKFLKSVMTRGQDTAERKGMHASAIIKPDNQFCYRQQVLSLFYKQLQGEQVPVKTKRIFTEGDAIHEKWQRLFIRGGLVDPLNCDYTLYNKEYDLIYTPDLNHVKIGNKELVGEIKSVNTIQFQRMVREHTEHASGKKQLQLYMFLTGIHDGFVLCEDKNTQEIKVFLYEYNPEIVKPFKYRLEKIQEHKHNLLTNHKMVKRKKGCNSYNCKLAKQCPMRDVCYNRTKERL